VAAVREMMMALEWFKFKTSAQRREGAKGRKGILGQQP
jgi:hypothetical protein